MKKRILTILLASKDSPLVTGLIEIACTAFMAFLCWNLTWDSIKHLSSSTRGHRFQVSDARVALKCKWPHSALGIVQKISYSTEQIVSLAHKRSPFAPDVYQLSSVANACRGDLSFRKREMPVNALPKPFWMRLNWSVRIARLTAELATRQATVCHAPVL